MKKLIITSVLGVLLTASATLMAQRQPDEYLGLPGDNLNLYAVMKLFQESETLEAFERSLNDQDNRINNLDLNGDNYVDYIRIINYVDDNVHTIILQAMLDRDESQDVAVFTVERFSNGAVQIQLIGDELLYGRNYIVEPNYAETPNPGYSGRTRNVTYVTTTYVEVAAWPLIRFIYRPGYVVWRSRWYWGYYPSYWSPWRPLYWHYYYGYHYHWHPVYYVHYRRWHEPRYVRYHDVYYSRYRVFAPVVNININNGRYNTTYSRPESRKDGEALFARTNPDQYRRSAAVAGTVSERRPVAQSTSSGQTTRTSSEINRRSVSGTSAGQSNATDRRSPATVNSRTNTGTSAGRSTATERRESSAVNNRANTGTSAGQSTATERRQSATVNSRTNTNTSASRSSATERRQSVTVNNRANTGTSAGQSNASSRRTPAAVSSGNSSRAQSAQRATSSSRTTTRQTQKAATSSARRSSEGNKASASQKKNENTRSSENSSSSRRK